MTVITYHRTGGPAPRSDELLEVEDSGAATLRRVVNEGAVGEFADGASDSRSRKLAKAIGAAAGTEVRFQPPGRPPYETEEIVAGSDTFRFTPHQKVPKPVDRLRDQLVNLAAELVEHPVSALRLTLEPPKLTITAVGSQPSEVEWNGAVTFDLFGEDESIERSGQLELGVAPGPTSVDPGWSAEVELPADVNFNAKKTLQVRATLRMKFADGRWRDAQVTAVAGKGWT